MTKDECEIETSKAIMKMRNRIVELEKEISVLLSCKNCSENKGGYICQKEYEDKCLSQKTQYIKELQEENAELKREIENDRDIPTIAYMYGAEKQKKKDEKQLTEAKEIIRDLLFHLGNTFIVSYTSKEESITKAEQFLKEYEKE